MRLFSDDVIFLVNQIPPKLLLLHAPEMRGLHLFLTQTRHERCVSEAGKGRNFYSHDLGSCLLTGVQLSSKISGIGKRRTLWGRVRRYLRDRHRMKSEEENMLGQVISMANSGSGSESTLPISMPVSEL